MQTILDLQNITKSFTERPALDGVNLSISDTDRIGVIGVNGTGKSTLLAIAAGAAQPDEGRLIPTTALRIAYLPQNPLFDEEKTILENTAAAISGKESYWDTTGEARAMLLRFGIEDPDRFPGELSGGQRKRCALAAVLLTPCDLLILDEPTNHLDTEMTAWLENWLLEFKGAVLLVTHDRYFLDSVTDTIVEIDRGKLYRYEENYSGYLEKREERLAFAAAAERKMAALYKKDLAWMLRGARARSTKQKAHIQRFEALRDREKPEEERELLIKTLPSRLGGTTIELEGVGKGFNGKELFKDFTYRFGKHDRIGIVGKNGCGKTTLLKVITGELAPDSGSVVVGQTVRLACFSQENEALPENERLIDYVKDAAEFIETADGYVSASSMCERFLFDSGMQYTPIAKLSGGEKRRLYLLHLLMTNPNVLILDEPTNDLDIRTLQILEDYLDSFAGIVVAVSHDRYFLDRVVTRIFAFGEDGILVQSEGGYTDYRNRLGEQEKSPAQSPGKTAGKAQPAGGAKGKASEGESGRGGRTHQAKKQLSYRDQKEYEGIEAEIEALEKEEERLAGEIEAAGNDYVLLTQLSRQKEETEAKLEERMLRFIELQDMLEALNSSEG